VQVTGSSLSTGCTGVTPSAITGLNLPNGVLHWFVLRRSGTISDTNFYRVCINTAETGTDYKDSSDTGVTWTNPRAVGASGKIYGSLSLVDVEEEGGGGTPATSSSTDNSHINFDTFRNITFVLFAGTAVYFLKAVLGFLV